jgi:hypothetical protein
MDKDILDPGCQWIKPHLFSMPMDARPKPTRLTTRFGNQIGTE